MPLFHWCVAIFIRSLLKLLVDPESPDKSKVRLGDREPEETEDGDGGCCCGFQMPTPGDNIGCGLLTKKHLMLKITHKTLLNQLFTFRCRFIDCLFDFAEERLRESSRTLIPIEV